LKKQQHLQSSGNLTVGILKDCSLRLEPVWQTVVVTEVLARAISPYKEERASQVDLMFCWGEEKEISSM
jgi:hypothetical protein